MQKLSQIQVDAAVALFGEERYQEAAAAAQAMLAVAPGFGLGWKILGTSQLLLGQDASAALTRAGILLPNDGAVFANLGKALLTAQRYEEAAQACRRAIAIDGKLAEACCNLAAALRELGKPLEVVAAFRDLCAAMPEAPAAWSWLGTALMQAGEYEEAEAAFGKALRLAPDFADAMLGMGFLRLTQGNYAEGWRYYEARWRVDTWTVKIKTNSPRWDGSQPLAGKTLLLLCEQGFGDSIQFVRYAAQFAGKFADSSARIVLVAQEELKPLFAGLPGIDALIGFHDQMVQFDYHCTLMSLPFAFQSTTDNIALAQGYLQANAGRAQAWQVALGESDAEANADANVRTRVGVVWAGNPKFYNDRNRSIPYETFAALFAVPCCRFHSLQKRAERHAGEHATLPPDVIDLAPHLRDFSETAALIHNLDLVITVDTSVAHLAGAMGKETWLLLPYVPDWRWMLHRPDTPWYDSLRLFRQSAPGDWTGVIETVARELSTRYSSLGPSAPQK